MIAYHSNNILNQDNTKIKTNFVVMTLLAVLLKTTNYVPITAN